MKKKVAKTTRGLKKNSAPKTKSNPTGAGRPSKIEGINVETVRQLAMINCSYEEMAAVLQCDISLLTRNFSQLIRDGREQGTMSLKRKQFTTAMKGSVPMLIWLGKNRLGQKDVSETTHNIGDPLLKMSREELERELQQMEELDEFKSQNKTKALEPAREVIEIEGLAIRQTGTDDQGTDT